MDATLKTQLIEAIQHYREVCRQLVDGYEGSGLAPEWRADEHGEHCRFENRLTGYVVEAPFELSDEWFYADPYFLGMFIKAGDRFPSLQDAIDDEYSDTADLLDALREEGVDVPGLSRPGSE